MNKSYKIFSGIINGQPFKLILYDNFDNKKVEYRFGVGLDRGVDKFFRAMIEELKLEDKRKKERDFCYLSLTGGSSGGGGQ